MKNYIREKLKTKLEETSFAGPDVKWDTLEHDVETAIMSIIEKNKHFGLDSYAVIDAIYQIMERMFPKVR